MGHEMENLDLLKMSVEDLTSLSRKISAAIKTYDVRRKAYDVRRKTDAKVAVESLAREHGFSLAELVYEGLDRKGKKGLPKFRNPEDTSITWTGRGPKPWWVAAHLQAGGDLEDLRIAWTEKAA